ncbi:MAG: type II toxin-antitoxin system VapC family toxin [Deltaproteobacteria bacterium]|jgi:predicted nucleic acid-binding protein|nr:type II toxin-antitoxin system VapC family toxin [Deltaproteobacteria bacterium]MBT4640402.1 type II toxin-antitoxin system VapC family toxin [Deltaproteobacteria bacterium]MBT7888326.1 type II toxin-antitoxin system VapC family toxin [Deltaproteobacteria bacterium]
MIFDTDIFIWVQRGNGKVATLVEKTPDRFLSIQTYMELLQGATSKDQHKHTKSFIKDFNFMVLPLTENIGHRALVYVEEYGLSNGIRAGDAIIAATAVENNLPLSSSNKKHFKAIRDLNLKVFKP